MVTQFMIYTDGSCNNKLPMNVRSGGWAFVVLAQDGTLIYSRSGYEPSHTTSQRMEMTALIEALTWMYAVKIPAVNTVKDHAEEIIFRIFTDSAYIVNCFKEEWYRRWMERDFLNVKNEDLWKSLIYLRFMYPYIDVRFTHVRGHQGNRWNEEVDRMAGIARKTKQGTK